MDLGKMVLDEELLKLRLIIELIARSNMEKASAKGIVLKYSIDSDVPEVVRGDLVRLRQVLLNLVGYILEGGNS